MISALVFMSIGGCGLELTPPPPPTCFSSLDTLSFGGIHVGTSTLKWFLVHNPSNTPLELLPELTSPDFSLVKQGEPVTVPPGVGIRLEVLFNPVGMGERTASLDFGNDACEALLLTGFGVSPQCTIEPSQLDFGRVPVGDEKTMWLSISNASDLPIRTAPVFTWPEFSLVEFDHGDSITVPAKDSLRVEVRFSPTYSHERTATLSFSDGLCPDLAVRGWGDAVACVVEPLVVDFGWIPFRSTKTASVRVRNTGTLPFDGVLSECSEHFVISVVGGSLHLEPDQEVEVLIEFAPERSGLHECELSLGVPECESVLLSGQTNQLWNILADGTGDAPTIQAGIDSAVDWGYLVRWTGTYNEVINFGEKELILKSTEGPEATTIDGTGLDASVVIFEGAQSRACLLEGSPLPWEARRVVRTNPKELFSALTRP